MRRGKKGQSPRGLDGFQLKLIAIFCMVVDHVAWFFVPTPSVLSVGFWMHVMGRITFPVMAFMIAEGYRHTANIRKYLLRLGVFALLCMLPYHMAFHGGRWSFASWWPNNIFITLFFGLLSLQLTRGKKDPLLRLFIVLLCSLGSALGDWGVVGVPMIYLFGRVEEPRRRVWVGVLGFVGLYLANHGLAYWQGNGFAVTRWAVLGALLSIPLLRAYNGRRGWARPFAKQMFYGFYPLHLLALMAIRYIMTGMWVS